MGRRIITMQQQYLAPSLDFVEQVFSEWNNPDEGKMVRHLVEGDPKNYNPRVFETSADHGIVAGPNIHLPHVSCLMVKELVPGALKGIHGVVDYSFYETLREE